MNATDQRRLIQDHGTRIYRGCLPLELIDRYGHVSLEADLVSAFEL